MNLQLGAVPQGWLLAALLAMLPAWIAAIRTLASRRFADHSGQSHLFWAACLAVTLLWSIKATLSSHLTLHLLGITTVTLMFGVSGAVAVVTVALLALAAVGVLPWQTVPANALMMGLLPALVAQGWLWTIERYLPRHLFVFLFGAAFFGGALGMLATGALTGLVLGVAGSEPWSNVIDQYGAVLIHLAYAEGSLNGMLVTLMVVWCPGWVGAFDDARYLGGGRPGRRR